MQKSSLSHYFTQICTDKRMLNGEKPIYTDRASVLLPSGQVRGLHYHELCEVGICRHGSGLWFIGDRAYALSVGDAVIVPAGVAHYSRSVGALADKAECRCDFIYFDEVKLLSQSGITDTDFYTDSEVSIPTVFTHREREGLRSLLENMVNVAVECRNPNSNPEKLCRIAAHWYALFLLQLPRQKPEAPDLRLRSTASELTPALDKMLVDFTEPLKLEQLAEECAMSTSWFLKRFSHEYGTSPMKYLNRLRVTVAAELLLGSELSVTDIAGYVGFLSPSELYRHFKSTFGMSPIEYRKLKS